MNAKDLRATSKISLIKSKIQHNGRRGNQTLNDSGRTGGHEQFTPIRSVISSSFLYTSCSRSQDQYQHHPLCRGRQWNCEH